MSFWRSWKYKNLTFAFLGVVVAIILSRIEIFHIFLLNLGSLGYFGAFIAGILFVSTFTVATGALILFTLAKTLSPVEIGLIAGFGAVFGDFTIFRFIKNNLTKELETIYNHIDSNHHFMKVLHSKYFSWTLPVVGAIIITSPFPDEIGVSLMGISKMKTYQFLLISFVLNAIGIFLVVSAGLIIRP
ncbi:MAG: hypothetical protein Q7R31_04530 [Candidatus Levybacteria bacterium]|nr:hypothetical protein [Candidatus Levybacteria bacterium]